MHALVEQRRAARAIPLIAVTAKTLRKAAEGLGVSAASWVRETAFRADPGRHLLVPDNRGRLRAVLAGVGRPDDLYALAGLPYALPAETYRLEAGGIELDPVRAALGWGLGAYRFTRYRKAARAPARLAVDQATLRAVESPLSATIRVRNLVNTPTQDLGPAEVAAEVMAIAQAHGATFREWVGAQLLDANFPTVHAVGRAGAREPRVAELTWGDAKHPRLAVIGKGVCFDTGGLNIKSADGMRWMKKDMGGAAHAIALADMIMQARLPVRLTLIVPAVENAVSGDSYRPGEVIRTRAGITVEIDNTDAEGRLVLCDALACAVEQKPDAIVDFATLTGAARVALGADVPALFANDDAFAAAALAAGRAEQDPLWQLPLWQGYTNLFESRIADVANCGPSRHAGAITAALFLQRFVPSSIAWLHLDQYAWNDGDRPGKPQGGEAQGLRALFATIRDRYPHSHA